MLKEILNLSIFKNYFKNKKILNKLKELVQCNCHFEEESMMYTYEGPDKNDIWAVMEFFYKHLWDKNFEKYNYTDPTDEWENYNFYIHYKGKYTLISIIYGIGSTCIITSVEPSEIKTSKLIIELENVRCSVFKGIYFVD